MKPKATFILSAAAAAFLKPETSREEKLMGAQGRATLEEPEKSSLLLLLTADPDSEVRDAAVRSLRLLTEETALAVAAAPAAHPELLHVLARLHGDRPGMADLITANPACTEKTSAFLQERGLIPGQASPPCEGEDVDSLPGRGDDLEVDPEEEHQGKYQLAMAMEVPAKIKTALTGDKEWRTILLKDNNKLVSAAVLKNPRITEGEVLTIAKSQIQNDEIMRLICANKEWLKNYQIRKALVENHKTPLPTALRLLATLSDKDIQFIAKSKNISTVLSTQARKLVMAKSEKR